MPKLNKYVERLSAGRNQFKLRINLDEVFGTAFPNSSRLRQSVGQEIIDIINQRTSENRAWDGVRFKSYSKEYSESLEFQAAGKSKNDPNLKLTGDMLGLMDVIEEDKATITIGWKDVTEAQKAHGHITGNVGVKRDFFGLNEKEIKRLKDIFDDAVRVAQAETGPARSSVAKLGEIIEGTEQIKSTTLGALITELFGDDLG
jgi:hypothetical protein